MLFHFDFILLGVVIHKIPIAKSSRSRRYSVGAFPSAGRFSQPRVW